MAKKAAKKKIARKKVSRKKTVSRKKVVSKKVSRKKVRITPERTSKTPKGRSLLFAYQFQTRLAYRSTTGLMNCQKSPMRIRKPAVPRSIPNSENISGCESNYSILSFLKANRSLFRFLRRRKEERIIHDGKVIESCS